MNFNSKPQLAKISLVKENMYIVNLLMLLLRIRYTDATDYGNNHVNQ